MDGIITEMLPTGGVQGQSHMKFAAISLVWDAHDKIHRR